MWNHRWLSPRRLERLGLGVATERPDRSGDRRDISAKQAIGEGLACSHEACVESNEAQSNASAPRFRTPVVAASATSSRTPRSRCAERTRYSPRVRELNTCAGRAAHPVADRRSGLPAASSCLGRDRDGTRSRARRRNGDSLCQRGTNDVAHRRVGLPCVARRVRARCAADRAEQRELQARTRLVARLLLFGPMMSVFRQMGLLASFTVLAACAPMPAAPTEPTEAVRFDLDVDGTRQPFNSSVVATAEAIDNTLIVRVFARHDPIRSAVDDESSVVFEVRFDRAAFAALARGTPLPIDGTTTIANAGTLSHNTPPVDPAATTFVSGAGNTAAIRGVSLWRQCFCSRSPGADQQRYTGTVTITDVSPTRVGFQFALQAQGSIPFQTFAPSGTTTSAIRVNADFAVQLPSAR